MLKEYRTIVPYLREHAWRYILGIIALVAVDAVQLLIPQYIRKAIDSVAAGDSGSVVAAIGLSIVGTAAAIVVGRFLWRFFIHGASRRIQTSMRDRLFSRLMTLPTAYFHTTTVGDVMALATNDMQAIRMATGMGFVTFVDGAFMSVAILVVMFAQNPGTTIWTVAPLPFVTVLIIMFGRIVGKRFKKVQELYSDMSTVAQETMAGIRVVKSFVKEDVFAARFSDVNDGYRDASMSLVRVDGFFFPLISFLAGLTTLALVVAGGAQVLENRMSPGDMAAMIAYLEMLVWPMVGAGFTVNMIQRGATSLHRVNAVLDILPEPRYAVEEGRVDADPRGAVRYKELSYVYPGGSKPALAGVDFELPEGKTLGVLGRVGSGKSSLVRLLARIEEPPRGAVLIGGVDVGAYPLERLRRSMAFVPQDSFLFSDSIRANITFADPGLPDERFRRITAISALDQDLSAFPDGWDTVVGERGLTLSGGQKQRVAIARALAADADMLVLDDALSAVDAETEETILAALMAERAGRTTIIISNRVSTLRRADLVAVFDEGRLAQFGPPEALAREDGFFAEIAAMQALAASEDR